MNNKRSELFEWIQAIVIAVVLASLLRMFVFEIIEVEGSSMIPTLHNGDRIAVDKISYRFASPKRGDIVVFKNPSNPSENYIKRVIALEGDTVEITDGKLLVNGEIINEPYINELPASDFELTKVNKKAVFVLGDNRNFSRDSRFKSVGCIPIKSILGKAKLRIWPFHSLQWFK